MNFYAKLERATRRADSLLCVGLDADFARLPTQVGGDQFEFNKAIIDATHDVVGCYKPNPAFYEARGVVGVQALKDTCDYLHKHYPEIPIILDAKRGDIGNTNAGYAQYVFDYLGADAITLHPYMGQTSLQVFLDYKDKGMLILCRTSNPGAGEFQDLIVNGAPLYQHVARQVATSWNTLHNCGLVVGATYPEELRAVREIVGSRMPILVPGVGTQGGELGPTLAAGLGKNGMGLIINASRAVLFASSGHDYAATARAEALRLRDDINRHRKELTT